MNRSSDTIFQGTTLVHEGERYTITNFPRSFAKTMQTAERKNQNFILIPAIHSHDHNFDEIDNKKKLTFCG